MIERPLWVERILDGWKHAPLAWLAGVRRVGKTILAQSLPDAEIFNCDLPSVADRLRDPENFFRAIRAKRLVLDEVHQLPDPSRLLKIAADAFPHIKVLATGSSTLAATRKFRDSLAGRKRVVELVPVLLEELDAFGIKDIRTRLLRGGLPQALSAEQPPEDFYAEWLDSYFARDLQELYHLEKRAAFLKVLELLMRQSGGMLEITSLAKHGGVSRQTIMHWLDIFQVTLVAHALRPFADGGRREIVAQPKVYAFDTGFVCYARGWEEVRADECGLLWEHVVLETLLSIPVRKLHFWRDKQQRKVDFVVPQRRDRIDAIECKWRADAFDPRGLAAFRNNYPKGRNLVVSPDISASHIRRVGALQVRFVPPSELRQWFA